MITRIYVIFAFGQNVIKLKKGEMARACALMRNTKMHTGFWSENLIGGDTS